MTTSAPSSPVKREAYQEDPLTPPMKPQQAVGVKSARRVLFSNPSEELLSLNSLAEETFEEKNRVLGLANLSARSIGREHTIGLEHKFEGKAAAGKPQQIYASIHAPIHAPCGTKLELIHKSLMSSEKLFENHLWSDIAELLCKICSQEKEAPLNSCLEMISSKLGVSITHKNFNTLFISVSDLTDPNVPDFINSIKNKLQIELEVIVKTFKGKLDIYNKHVTSLLLDGKYLTKKQVSAKEYIKDFPNLRKLVIDSLETITTVTLNSNPALKDVSIINCPLIYRVAMRGVHFDHLEIRDLPDLRELSLSNCTLGEECFDYFETQLPLWKELTVLELVNCQLTDDALETLAPKIVKLSKLTSIKLSGNAITYIPKAFGDEDCHLKKQIQASIKYSLEYPIPELPGNKMMLWVTERSQIESNPLDVLYNLALGLKDSSQIKVLFSGEKGRDAGGLSREFFAKLFRAFKEKYVTQDGYPTWDRSVMIVGEENQMLEAIYKGLGVVLAFLIGKRGIYPIGDIFSHEVFEGLVNCTEKIISKSYAELSLEELASLCSKSFRNTLNMKDLLNFFSAKTSLKAAQYLDAVSNVYLGCGEDVPDEYKSFSLEFELSSDFFESLKLKAKRALFYYCASKIRPILEIARGIKQVPVVWTVFPKLTARFLEQTVQGTLAKGTILHNLNFQTEVPKEQQEWLKAWLMKANNQELANFLVYVTGAPSLTKGKAINIKVSPEKEAEGLSSHTCWHLLNIPPKMDQEKLWMLLDDKTTGFNIR